MRFVVPIVLLLVSLPVLFVRQPRVSVESRWKQFEVVLVRSGELSATVIDELGSIVPGFVSSRTATVEIENFSGGEQIFLADVPERLDDQDPRLDPFLKAGTELFVASGPDERYDIVYVPVSVSTRKTDRQIRSIFPSGSVVFPDSRIQDRWIFMIAGVFAAGILIVVSTVSSIVYVLPLLSLAWSVYIGGSAALVRLVLLFFSLVLVLEQRDEDQRQHLYSRSFSRIHRFSGPGIFLGLSLMTLFFEPNPGEAGIDVLLFLLQVPAMELFRFAVMNIRLHASEHRVFSPVPIIRRTWQEYFSGLFSRGLVWAPAIVIVALFSVHLLYGRSGVEVPVPVRSGDVTEITRELPVSLSTDGYLAHRAYQSALVFGWGFQRPSPGDSVRIQQFSRENGGIETHWEPVFIFDDAWFTTVLSDVEPGSLYALFAGEQPARFSMQDAAGMNSGVRDRLPALVLICLLSVLLPVLSATRLRFVLSAGRFGVSMKRNRQEA